jgi:biopolymer transport protein ExbD
MRCSLSLAIALAGCDASESAERSRAADDRLARIESRLVEIEDRVAELEGAPDNAREVLPIELPRAASGDEFVTTVSITLTGKRAFLDGKAVTDDELAEQLRQVATTNPNTRVILDADAAVPYERVVQAIDHVKLAGLRNVVLSAHGGPPPPPPPSPPMPEPVAGEG